MLLSKHNTELQKIVDSQTQQIAILQRQINELQTNNIELAN